MASKETAISLPFSINAYGRVNTTTDKSKLWQDRVRSVIGTYLGERVMRPDFGSDVTENVFESSEEAKALIQTNIREAFATNLVTLTLSDVIVDYDENTGVLNAEVIYALPDARIEDVESTTIGIVRIGSDLPPIQEIL